MTNLLSTYSKTVNSFWKRLSKFKKVIIVFVVVIFTFCALLGFWGVFNINKAREVMDEAIAGKQSFEYAQVAVANQNFVLAAKDLDEANKHFDSARDKFARFKIYRIVPGVAKQIKAIDNLLLAGINLSSGLKQLVDLGAEVTDIISTKEGSVSFADITSEEKKEILKTLSESPADLHGLKSEIELAIYFIEEIPSQGVLKQIRDAIEPIKAQLPILQTIINQAIPAVETLPTILGYPNEKTYLFLLQNNRELRPTGGFIGTYGILKLNAGEISKFETDNVYNLDNAAADYITEPSPAPIAAHTTTQNWLLRNANWSPDFPTSARKAESKYLEEGGDELDIDGVIAVTPTFIEALLELTGSIEVDGLEFTHENLFETLEHQVEFGFLKQGIDHSERKEIIGDLATVLLEQLMGFSKTELPELWETFTSQVDQKQILIYVHDPITQDLVIKQNWAGEMKSYHGDYLMFVDANMAALKTDNVMERNVSYSVEERGGDYIGKAQMNYKNTGGFDGFHTRYRTHTRIYIPYGSELISSEGFLTGDKIQNGVPTDPDVYSESFTHANGETTRYTVVAGFIAIEPGEEGYLRIEYKLPKLIEEQIQNGQYTLYVQKQAGTIAHGLQVSFDIGEEISSVSSLDISEIIGKNKMSSSTDLEIDRKYTINLK